MIKADMMLAVLAVELAAQNIHAPTVIQPEGTVRSLGLFFWASLSKVP